VKILHTVQFYSPVVGGSEEGVRQVSERLAARGHDVTVATARHPGRRDRLINGVAVEEFDLSGNAALGIRGDAEGYRNFILHGGFDIVLNYAAQTWATDLVLPILDRVPARKVLVPCGYSGLTDGRYARYFAALPEYLRRYDRIIYLSPRYRDAAFGEQHGIGRSVVIPNGADEREFDRPAAGFRQWAGIDTRYLVITVANHYTSKGHAFVIAALRRLGRADVTLAIVGRMSRNPLRGCGVACRFAALRDRRVRLFPDLAREWVVSALQEADLFVFGSRLECAPLVIYEAFASRLPVISTPVGNVPDHQGLVEIVDTVDGATRAVADLLDDAARRREKADRGWQLWRDGHTWESIALSYEREYERLLSA
jgi:glycosyltransferase involved in cell wall biosynthesis